MGKLHYQLLNFGAVNKTTILISFQLFNLKKNNKSVLLIIFRHKCNKKVT